MKAVCTRSASARSGQATTTPVGMPRLTSSACEGPDRADDGAAGLLRDKLGHAIAAYPPRCPSSRRRAGAFRRGTAQRRGPWCARRTTAWRTRPSPCPARPAGRGGMMQLLRQRDAGEIGVLPASPRACLLSVFAMRPKGDIVTVLHAADMRQGRSPAAAAGDRYLHVHGRFLTFSWIFTKIGFSSPCHGADGQYCCDA